MSNEDLINKLSSLLKNYSPFEVSFKGVSLSHDNYVLLNCIKGDSILIDLHDKIYKEIIPTHLKKSIKYIPHITLGQADNLNDFSDFNYEFSTIIDTISVEFIGNNEESIILTHIKLKK
jgi:2'-5' RNA ligase